MLVIIFKHQWIVVNKPKTSIKANVSIIYTTKYSGGIYWGHPVFIQGDFVCKKELNRGFPLHSGTDYTWRVFSPG